MPSPPNSTCSRSFLPLLGYTTTFAVQFLSKLQMVESVDCPNWPGLRFHSHRQASAPFSRNSTQASTHFLGSLETAILLSLLLKKARVPKSEAEDASMPPNQSQSITEVVISSILQLTLSRVTRKCQSSETGSNNSSRSATELPHLVSLCAPTCLSHVSWSPPQTTLFSTL